MSKTLAMILAGGEGTRLLPLTASRSKPAVPFGGSYRLIDFVLNNFVNSGIFSIFVITQYKSQSLYLHMKNGWTVSGIPNCFIDSIPAQMRVGKEWYQGTADAIYQNLTFIDESRVDNVCIFGSDHIYKMDVRQMLDFHNMRHGDLTVAAIRLPSAMAAGKFGVIEVDKEARMIGFEEKPQTPKEIPGDPGYCLVSIGNYVFRTEVLREVLKEDEHQPSSSHDFGKDIIPLMYPRGEVYVYDLSLNYIKGEQAGYWRDVGSIDAYFEAHMDLLSSQPKFRLDNPNWPLHTYYPPLPPANFTDCNNHSPRIARSLISAGCEICGAHIENSVLGFSCYVGDSASIEDSVLLGDCKIGRNCKIKHAILDRDVQLADGFCLGYDRAADLKLVAGDDLNSARISDGGVIVIPKGMRLGFKD
ncbi:MAG: glucose-1-phosphate adenylyltransferase [Succinivibrio sp.]|nr:glucose-1-phosphate adenylyltransferase [Succinivibrio sp.]